MINFITNIQLRNDYTSLTGGASSEFGSYGRTQRVSPRSSRSGTPVQGETASASLNVTRRLGTHGGTRNKKPKETILSASERPPYIGNQFENIEDLVSYITGEPEKSAQNVKKTKKKTKRKETLSKSHSLDENTLTDVNPSIETRSVSSTLLENKSDEKGSGGISTAGLDLSSPSVSKLESLRSHSSSEFITVINRKKNKSLKTSDAHAQKSSKYEIGQPQQEDLVIKTNSNPHIRLSEAESNLKPNSSDTPLETEIKSKTKQGLKEDCVPKVDPVLIKQHEPLKSVFKHHEVLKSESLKQENLKQENSLKVKSEGKPEGKSEGKSEGKPYKEENKILPDLSKAEVKKEIPVGSSKEIESQEKSDRVVTNVEIIPPCSSKSDTISSVQLVPTVANPDPGGSSNQKERYRNDPSRKSDVSMRRYPSDNSQGQSYVRKYPEVQRRQDGTGRRPELPVRKPEQSRRKERGEGFIQPPETTIPPSRRPQFSRHDSEPRFPPSRYREPVSKSASLSSDSTSSYSVKGEEAVKFCGVNFENKGDMLQKPNVTVEFGFGVTDVLTQLATASPPEVVTPNNTQPLITQPIPQARQTSPVLSSSTQSFVPDEIQQPARHSEPVMKIELKQPTTTGGSDASLLGRHPHSGQSPPVHYLPMSSVPLSLSGTGYQISGANYYQTIQQQVPLGVVQYYPGPHIQPIQQISAPIMTAIPSQGTASLQQQFMNPLTLTPQQHQLLQHQQQLLQQQQQHPQTAAYNAALQQQQQQQQVIQYQQVLLKSTPPQQQFTMNQQNMAQYPQAAQNTVQQHAQQQQQQSYNSQGHGGSSGNFNYHRNTSTPRSNHNIVNCSPQMGNYAIGIQHQTPQYGSPVSQYVGQNSGHQSQSHGHTNYNQNPSGPPSVGGVHYSNYHRNNSNSRSNHNVNSPGSHYGSQPSPQGNSGSGQGQQYAQPHRQVAPASNHNQNQNPRSLSSNQPAPVSLVVNPPSPDEIQNSSVLEVAIFVDPETNPLGQYYISPTENEEYLKLAKMGEDYMNTYIGKISERIDKGIVTVHHI